MSLSEGQVNTTYAFRVISATLTLFGATYMLGTILLYKRFKFFNSRLIFWMTCSAGATAFQWLVPPNPAGASCWFQSLWSSFFDFACVVWITAIALNTWLTVVRKVPHTERYERYYHVAGWGVPAFFTLLPLIGGVYGPSGNWCWIRAGHDWWRFFMFYFWLLLLFLLVCIAYLQTAMELRRLADDEESEFYRRQTDEQRRRRARTERNLSLYVVVFIILWLPAIINRFVEWGTSQDIFVLVLLHSICAPLQGFVNSVVYATTEEGMLRPLKNPRETFQLLVASLSGGGGAAGSGTTAMTAYEFVHEDVDGDHSEEKEKRDEDGHVELEDGGGVHKRQNSFTEVSIDDE